MCKAFTNVSAFWGPECRKNCERVDPDDKRDALRQWTRALGTTAPMSEHQEKVQQGLQSNRAWSAEGPFSVAKEAGGWRERTDAQVALNIVKPLGSLHKQQVEQNN